MFIHVLHFLTKCFHNSLWPVTFKHFYHNGQQCHNTHDSMSRYAQWRSTKLLKETSQIMHFASGQIQSNFHIRNSDLNGFWNHIAWPGEHDKAHVLLIWPTLVGLQPVFIHMLYHCAMIINNKIALLCSTSIHVFVLQYDFIKHATTGYSLNMKFVTMTFYCLATFLTACALH